MFQHSKCCLIALPFFSPVLCSICFFLPSFTPSTHPPTPSLFSVFPPLLQVTFLLRCSRVFFMLFLSSDFCHQLVSLSSSLSFIFHLIPTLCAPVPKSSNSHLFMSPRLPTRTSSCFIHEEKLARRSDNLLTPHLSSERGKAPS